MNKIKIASAFIIIIICLFIISVVGKQIDTAFKCQQNGGYIIKGGCFKKGPKINID